MRFSEELLKPYNVKVTTYERGKRVPKYCYEEHNIWVNSGREYLARVVAPNSGLTDHYNEPPREFVAYMGVGIGGSRQTNSAAYTAPLSADYPPADAGGAPGNTGNQQVDTLLTVSQLERPVKIKASSPIWLAAVATPVVFSNSNRTVSFTRVFSETDINLSGTYSVVPVSELALFLSTQDPDAANVYDVSNTPSMIGAGRQTLVAYKTIIPIPKTSAFSFVTEWELRF